MEFRNKNLPSNDWFNFIYDKIKLSYPDNFRIPEDVLIEMYINKSMSMYNIAHILNTGVAKVFNDIKYYNIPTRKQVKLNYTKNDLPVFSEFKWGYGFHPLLSRKTRLINSSGYVQLYIPEHHLSDKNGYVYEHRLVAEEILDRPLLDYEVVHHRDGNKQNNSPENLDILSRSDHTKLGHNILSKFSGVKTSIEGIEDKWLDVVGEVYSIFCSKNADYGPNNIAALGEEGIVVRLFDKFSRIKRLIFDKENIDVTTESVEDPIIDLIDYGIILLLVRRGLWPQYQLPDFSSWENNDEFRDWLRFWNMFDSDKYE